jgi:hypothetical protein
VSCRARSATIPATWPTTLASAFGICFWFSRHPSVVGRWRVMRTTFSSELAGLLTDGEQADLEMKFRWRKKVPAKILLELSELKSLEINALRPLLAQRSSYFRIPRWRSASFLLCANCCCADSYIKQVQEGAIGPTDTCLGLPVLICYMTSSSGAEYWGLRWHRESLSLIPTRLQLWCDTPQPCL